MNSVRQILNANCYLIQSSDLITVIRRHCAENETIGSLIQGNCLKSVEHIY